MIKDILTLEDMFPIEVHGDVLVSSIEVKTTAAMKVAI